MTFSYSRLFLEGSTFCCCLPVRLGVISMSTLGCLVAGLLTVVLWFEVSTPNGLTSGERDAFVLAALTETILFGSSVFGLIGAIVRKRSLIRIYGYILYIHFVINFAVAAYLAYEVIHATSDFEGLACQTAIKDPQAQGQCEGLLSFARWVYVVIVSVVLVVEIYGAIIVTRYLNQLERRKTTRFDTSDRALELKVQKTPQYTRLEEGGEVQDRFLEYLPPLEAQRLGSSEVEFDPYTESGFDRQTALEADEPSTSTEMVLDKRSLASDNTTLKENLAYETQVVEHSDERHDRDISLHASFVSSP